MTFREAGGRCSPAERSPIALWSDMPAPRPEEIDLSLVLICHDPPPAELDGHTMEFGAQDKAGALHAGSVEADGAHRFELAVRARPGFGEGSVDFGGPFVHGVPQGRFLYLGYRPVGETVWTRRWKVPLAAITAAQVAAAQAGQQALQARISASSGSTARLLGFGWTLTGSHTPSAGNRDG